MVVYALTGWGGLIISGRELGLLARVVLPVGGAMCAALLWKELGGKGDGGVGGEGRHGGKKGEEESPGYEKHQNGVAMGMNGVGGMSGEKQLQPPQQQHEMLKLQNGYTNISGVGPDPHMRQHHHQFSGDPGWEVVAKEDNGLQHQHQQLNGGGPYMGPPLPGGVTAHLHLATPQQQHHRQQQQQQLQHNHHHQHAWTAFGAGSDGAGLHGDGLGPGVSPRKWLARRVSSSGGRGGKGGGGGLGGLEDDVLLPLTLTPQEMGGGRSYGRGQMGKVLGWGTAAAMQRIVGVSFVGVVVAAISYGMHLAWSLASVGGVGHAMVPAVLQGILLCLMLHGVMLQLLPHRVRQVAAAVAGVASIGPGWALLALLLLSDAATAGVVAWAEALQLLACGFLLVAGALLCWPVAVGWHRHKGLAGGLLGGLVTAGGVGVLGALCWATPYCIRQS